MSTDFKFHFCRKNAQRSGIPHFPEKGEYDTHRLSRESRIILGTWVGNYHCDFNAMVTTTEVEMVYASEPSLTRYSPMYVQRLALAMKIASAFFVSRLA